jgi:hypothetical protein
MEVELPHQRAQAFVNRALGCPCLDPGGAREERDDNAHGRFAFS